MADWQNGVFALPCGADFPGAFADGLIARMRGRPAQDMARVTVYANSGQSLMALRDALIWRGPIILPRLRLIADLGGGSLLVVAGSLLWGSAQTAVVQGGADVFALRLTKP